MRKTNKRFSKLGKLLALGLSLALTVTTVTGCGDSGKDAGSSSSDSSADTSGSGDATTLRLGVMTGNIDHLVVAIGQEKGFFKDNGIDLQVTEYAAGINTVDALTMDQIDVGIAADFAILNRLGNTEGSDLKIVANYANATGGQFYANPETVKSIDELNGKKIINLPGVVYEYWKASMSLSMWTVSRAVWLLRAQATRMPSGEAARLEHSWQVMVGRHPSPSS